MTVASLTLAAIALLGLAVAYQRQSVLGGVCATAALGCGVAALVTNEVALTALGVVALGMGAVLVVLGTTVWSLLGDAED